MTMAEKFVCFTIDVERDYRLDGKVGVRGVTEGLPAYVGLLRDRGIPFDLMVSAEIIPDLPRGIVTSAGDLVSLGCHGNVHAPGYLNRLSTPALESDIRSATELILRTYSRMPVSFRAPNFSADGRTLRVLQSLGYQADSSVLPGRWVKRWKLFPLIDHRGVPEDPYFTDEAHFPMPGRHQMLEIPVSPNRALPGGPLGLGFLNSHGPEAFLKAMALNPGRFCVILLHSWEMVSWEGSVPVASWVRTASKSEPRRLVELIERLDPLRFVNTRGIIADGAGN